MDNIQYINQRLNIIRESDITIQKKKLSKISSLLKKQTNKKALNNPNQITIVNDGKTQKIEIQNKENSLNNIKVDHPDKNYTVPIQQDKRDRIIQNREVNLQQGNQKKQQLCQDPSKLVKSNKSSSQEKSNQTHQINQQFNEDQFYVEDSDIPVNPNTLKLDEEPLKENLLKKKSSLNQKKKKNNCIQNILKCLTQCSKTLRKCFCCKQNPTSISTIQNEVYSDKQQIITFDDQQPCIEQYEDQQLPMQVNLLSSLNEIIQNNNSQENFNKMISDILEYDFAEFEQEDQQNQVSQIYDENLESDIQHNIVVQFRKWSFDTFNQLNQNLRQNFVQNRDLILLELRKFNYFICKQFFSQDNMDLFVGYFQSNRGQVSDHIFKIYYSPNTLDISEEIEFIQKYDQIKDYQIVQNYHISITENIQILIMSKKTFLKLQSKSKKFQLLSYRYWNKNFFNDINDDKPFQLKELQKHTKQCKNCLPNKDCNEIKNLRKFELQQDKILDKLQEKGIFLCEYVNKGGEGVIFEGYRKNQQDYDDFIFKIQFESDEKDIQEEIEIMKLFEMNINVIKFIDFFKIQDKKPKIHVLILEKCKYSLADELLIFQQNKSFKKTQLFKIIFDLLDGLIQLRIYNILHLDIKPANILLSYQGNYIYTDFGMSSIKKDYQQTNIKGCTPSFQSPEQKHLDPNIDFKSDVYSLGITFLKVIDIYEKLSNDESIKLFKDNIIKKKMIQPSKISRDDCLKIHESYLQTLIQTNNEKQILDNYIFKIETILNLSTFDKNKDIPYFLNLKLYYSLKLLYLFNIKISHQNLAKIDTPFSINDSKFPQITIQQTNNLNKLQLLELNYIVQLVDNISICYYNSGKYQQSLPYFNISLQMRKQIFRKYHPSIATSLNNVGNCYQSLGDNKKALEYLLESLQMRKQIFKENHPSIAASLNSIGYCYQYLGEYKKALEYLLESLQITKQLFIENYPDIAVSLNNVSLCYDKLGEYKKALEYQLESLQMRKQIFEENHPSIATSLNNVGSIYLHLGDKKKGFDYQLESLQMRKYIFKENHPDIANSLHNVGSCYEDFGDNKIALEYLLESLQMRKQIFKENHPLIANSLYSVGQYYKNFGDNKKALEYLLESLQMRKQIFKENHPDIVDSLNNVWLCYIYLGEYKKALEYQLESLQMKKQIFKENHIDIEISLSNVGLCYIYLGEYKKALEYLLESLQMKKQIFKENHPDIATSLNNIGICYQNLGDNKNALEYQLESLQMTKQIFKKNHIDIAISLNNVGSCYQSLGDNKKALEYYLESLQMRKQIFKANHPSISTSLNNIGSCYQKLGDNKKALEYLLESLQMTKRIFKENHPDIERSLNNVVYCYQNLGDYKIAQEYLLESHQMTIQILIKNH